MLDSAMMNFTPMKTSPPLPGLEQARLVMLARAGNQQAVTTLIQTNLNIAVKIALSYHRRLPPHTLSPYELIHTAVLALPKAIEPFDPAKGTVFGSYAALYMKRDIIDYLREVGLIYVPKRKDNKEKQLTYCYLDSGTEDFHVPELGCGPDQSEIENKMDVAAALQKLSPTQRRIVRQHLGFDGVEMSFSEIGKAAGTSRGPQTTQYNKAIARLKTFFEVEQLNVTSTNSNERGYEVKHEKRNAKTRKKASTS